MIYTIVQLTVGPNRREKFVEVFKKEWNAACSEGSHNGKIMCAMEDPTRVDVLVEWDSEPAHRQHRGTPKSTAFRAAVINPYMTDWKLVHYEFEDLVP